MLNIAYLTASFFHGDRGDSKASILEAELPPPPMGAFRKYHYAVSTLLSSLSVLRYMVYNL